jgi:NAD(P)H-flavin reductase
MSRAGAIEKKTPWLARSVRIERVVEETPNVATYDLVFAKSGTEPAYRFQPGQFNMLYVPGVGEAAISLSGDASHSDRLQHTIRHVGDVTGAIARGGLGMQLGLRGPFGCGWPVDACDGCDVILVAGGIGLAPLRPAIYALLSQRSRYGNLTLLMGARRSSDILYSHHYSQWQEQGLQIEVTLDQPQEAWQGDVGFVTLLLARLALPRPEKTVLLTCGPEVMMRYVGETARDRKIPADRIWVSLERNMNCAIGLCGHCQLGPIFACKDGPVFCYTQVADWMRVPSL